jgi:hypothetical protein
MTKKPNHLLYHKTTQQNFIQQQLPSVLLGQSNKLQRVVCSTQELSLEYLKEA